MARTIQAEKLHQLPSSTESSSWLVSADQESGSHDQLFVSGSRVVWYGGLDPGSRKERVSYTMDTPVLQATWCQFNNNGVWLRGVCIREEATLTIFLTSGAHHYVPLPFQVRRVWALSNGLLVERGVAEGCGLDGLPLLFSVMHPTDDLCPVACRKPPGEFPRLCFFTEAGLQVLAVCDDGRGMPLLVTSNNTRYSIWSIRTASSNDVPAQPATPRKPDMVTPQHPLSSSAPSCYDNQTTPNNLMATPVEMILSTRRGAQNVLTQQRGPSGVKAGVSGRTPYLARLATPLAPPSGGKRGSRSLSPQILARVSPFSQAVNSRSWSTFYSDELSFGRHFEPLLPQLCVEWVWSHEGGHAHQATLHRTSDFSGRQYLLLSLSQLEQLWLIEVTSGQGEPLSLGQPTVLAGVRGIPLGQDPLLLALDGRGHLTLYSGPLKVASVAVQLCPDSALTDLRDPIANQFSLVAGSGLSSRYSLAQLFRHPAVSLLLRGVGAVLPAHALNTALADYYCTACSVPETMLTQHFEHWIISCLRLPPIAIDWQRDSNYYPPISLDDSPCLTEHAQTILTALHLVYEEMKLDVTMRPVLPRLAVLLYHMTSSLGLHNYAFHYWRDFPQLPQPAAEDAGETPAHIFRWLQDLLSNQPLRPFPVLPGVCSRTLTAIKLLCLYCERDLSGLVTPPSALLLDQFARLVESSPSPCQRVVLCLAQDGLSKGDIERFPVGVACPLLDALVRCQENPPSCWPPEAYNLIEREDVVQSLETDSSLSMLRMEIPDAVNDGMDIPEEVLRLRFPADQRVGVVRKFLKSCDPVRISVIQKPEVSDHEFLELQETKLLSLCQRTMALPVGRGIFTLSTARGFPTAPVGIPPLNLSGRVHPNNSTVSLEHVDKPADMSVWAEFHNGVAAGLKLVPGSFQCNGWLPLTTDQSANEQAGLLLGLGLQGHLAQVPHYELFNQLREKHELTVIGLLLGVAASSCGVGNLPVAGLLSLYFPPLLPHEAADMEVPIQLQTVAMMGLGLVHRGGGSRHLAELFLRELGRTQGPDPEAAEDRESYCLTAGLALGMLTLGLGSGPIGLADLNLVNQLRLLMNGGKKAELTTPPPDTSCHLVLEGDHVSTHVTCPGAVLALSLMYFDTNDSSVASMLAAPTSQFDLESVRPDFLLLRAMGWCLIMWGSVEPSVDWIRTRHIPAIVASHAFQSGCHDDSVDPQTMGQAYLNILAGACMGIGLRFAGTSHSKAKHCLLECLKEVLGKADSADIVGKACLDKCSLTILIAAAMVMSGSGDLDVMRVIRRVRLAGADLGYGSHMALHSALGLLFLGGGRYSLGWSKESIAALVISFYPTYPSSSTDNRYHLQAFRHLYLLAAQPRLLLAREAGSGRLVSVPVTIATGDSSHHDNTPCITPEWQAVQKISICGESYWPMTFDLSSASLRERLMRSGCLVVKQRLTHHLSQPSLPPSWSTGVGAARSLADIPDSILASNSLVKMLAQNFVSEEWAVLILDCLHRETIPALSALLRLDQEAKKLISTSDNLSSQHFWQIKLAQACCHGDHGSVVLVREAVNRIIMRISQSDSRCHGNISAATIEQLSLPMTH